MSSFSRSFTVHVSDISGNDLLNGGHLVELDPSTCFVDALAQLEVNMLHRALVQVKLKPFANSTQADRVTLRGTIAEKSVNEIDAILQRQRHHSDTESGGSCSPHAALPSLAHVSRPLPTHSTHQVGNLPPYTAQSEPRRSLCQLRGPVRASICARVCGQG